MRPMLAIGLFVLLHTYIGWRLIPALPAWAGALLAAALLASTLLIPAAFFGRRAARRDTADRWSWAGMTALGVFSMLLVLTLARDLLLLATAFATLPTLAAASAAAVPVLALGASAAGFAAARRTARVREVSVPIAGLPPALHGFTIAQVTDLHVGPTIKRGYVQAVVDRVNALQADVVALTGDLVDGRVEDLAADFAPLGTLRARHGVFAVTGNHEFYSGAEPWVAHWRTQGITPLRDEHRVLQHGGARLVLAGVDDPTARGLGGRRSDPAAALQGAPADAALRVLLAHQPRSAAAAADAGFDLQLSGHTHGGQFWPWNLLVPLQQPFVAGLHRLGRLWVYTSRGTGYWGPPLRLGAPSEISRLRLVAA